MKSNNNNQQIQIGQILYKETRDGFTEHEVISIGRKYFKCEGLQGNISISNLRHDHKIYSQYDYKLYISKQEILDKKEISKLYKGIKLICNNTTQYDFSLEQLRKIADIIGLDRDTTK